MAGLPPNLNIANPAAMAQQQLMQNNGAPTQNDQENKLEEASIVDQKKGWKRTVRNAFNISEMFLALPLLANSFVLQADNISDQADKVDDPGVAGYVANTFKTLSSVFKAFVDKFIAGGKTVDNIDSNLSANLTQNFTKRILHPNITKEFSALLFNTRRILFNFFPNVFTVPSADHDPLNPRSDNHASEATANFYGFMATITRPLTWVSSAFAALTTIPSHLMGSYFTYTGNEEAYKATKYFNRISEIFTPLLSNLSSMLSVSKSYIDSFLGKDGQHISKFVTRGRYNVGAANVIQGLTGAVTSLPYFFGIIGKLRDVVNEKDDKQNSKFSSNLNTLAKNILPRMTPFVTKYINKDFNLDQLLHEFKPRTEKFMSDFERLINNFLDSVYNATPFTKRIFANLRPTDGLGNIQAVTNNFTVEANDSTDYTVGLIKKASFFRELFDWLHPVQSMLMLLPNAIVTAKDAFINDNSLRTGRRLDRLLGFNSMLLSFPNYLMYGMSTRIPQLMMKCFEYLDRKHELDKQVNGGYSNKISGYEAYRKTTDWIRKLPIPGTHFIASKLESLNITQETFADEAEFREIFDNLDESARKQESSVKASELVNASRIGFRTILESESVRGSKFFYAARGPNGLTDEEQTRRGFYESVGKFKSIVGKIPVIGWVASPLIEGFRSFYKVDTSNRRNALTSAPNQQAALQQALQNQAATAAGLAA